MPRSRQSPAVSSQTVSLSPDLVRSVSSYPGLSAASLQCLTCLASEIRNNEITKTALLQSGAVNQILLELETAGKHNSRYRVKDEELTPSVLVIFISGLMLSTLSRECYS